MNSTIDSSDICMSINIREVLVSVLMQMRVSISMSMSVSISKKF